MPSGALSWIHADDRLRKALRGRFPLEHPYLGQPGTTLGQTQGVLNLLPAPDLRYHSATPASRSPSLGRNNLRIPGGSRVPLNHPTARVPFPASLRTLAAAALLLVASPLAAQEQVSDEPPPSACRQVTPLDAPYGCVEIIPLGASAWVTFDGMPLGLSPTGIPEAPPGAHTIRLDREGDWPWVHTFTLGEGEVLRIDPSLTHIAPRVAPSGPEEPYPLAIMVENYPDARPHYGLDLADVVYDALAEGGISRFLAVYITRDAEIVGPVRSTRHYFVYAAAEYNAALVFVGASPIGYAALSATGIRSVNESWGDPGIWRSVRRYAPHNAFTDTLEARSVADAKDPGGPGSWGPLLFKDPAIRTPQPPITSLRVRYPPGGWYSVAYEYDWETNRYLRFMDGYAHRDGATGEQLAARNVIVQVVPDEVIDPEGRLDLAQVGEGPALYFVDGTLTEGSWTKADFGSRTLYWDTAGNFMRLNPDGATWIQLVPPEAVVQYQ